ncbi:LOW QUALITY PROTEIN: hypothetical protein HID58_073726, partial [Brassica napus]
GAVPGTGPGTLRSRDPGCLLAGTQRPVSCLGLPLIARFRHRTRGITCALKSTRVAHSQQASLRQDIAPVILRSRVPLRPLPHSEPGGGPMKKLWASDGILEMVPVRDERGDGLDEASKFVPSRGVLFAVRGDLPRVYYPSLCSRRLAALQLSIFSLSLLKFLRNLHLLKLCSSFQIFRMKSKPDLALDSSSIGGRVRSKKQRSGVSPSESTDSSGSSLDLTAEVKNPSCTVADVAPPSIGFLDGPSFVDRSGRSRKLASAKYHLSDDVIIRIPGPVDRVSEFEVDEVLVYEGFFESGFRDRVPSLVAKVSEALEISPGSVFIRYHSPERWRTEVTSGGELLVQEIVKKERKRLPVFDGRWTEKFTFMYLRVSPLLVHSWWAIGVVKIAHSLCGSFFRREGDKAGVGASHRASSGPFSRRREALERCSIWGEMSGCKGEEEALAEYNRALEIMLAKKAAPKRAAPSETEDEVQFIRSSKCQATTALASSSKKKSKASESTPKVSPSSSSDPAKVFPLTLVVLPEGDSSASIQFIQSDLLQAMSHLFHLGERMGDHDSLKADLDDLTSQLREEKDILGRWLRRRECLPEGVVGAAGGGETFDAKKTMAMSGAKVVTCWELMREWLNRQTNSWDLEGALERYKNVKSFEADFQGIPAPSFEGEPMIPSKTEAEKTLEPAADDPPAI